MALDSGKHIEKDVDGVRCKIIETGVTKQRMEFLKELLEYNGYEVKVEEGKKKKPEDPTVYTVGVTDIVFNPVLAVYSMKLKTTDGRIVSPAYWRQETKDTKRQYYEAKM